MIGLLLLITWIIGAIVYVEFYVHVARTYCGGIPKHISLWLAYLCWPVLVVLYLRSQVRKNIKALKKTKEL